MKKLRAFTYYGLGFPVVLKDAPMMEIEGELVPNVDFNRTENAAAIMVSLKPEPLTGNEIRFMRRHLGLSQEAFAKRLDVTRQCVIGWEKSGDGATGMETATEKMLRLFILREGIIDAGLFEKAFDFLFAVAPKRVAWKCVIRANRPLNEKRILKEMLAKAA